MERLGVRLRVDPDDVRLRTAAEERLEELLFGTE
jgi:hypothetical protein